MKIIDIATEIYRELGQPTDIGVAFVNFYLVSNVGELNNLINTEYEIDSSGSEITPELGEEEKVIFKKLFFVYYYGKKILSVLTSASDSILEVSSDTGTVRMTNKNEISKSFVTLKKLEEDALKKLISGYRSKGYAPQQVAGDDTIAATQNPDRNFNRIN
jgi:hypothetical protein